MTAVKMGTFGGLVTVACSESPMVGRMVVSWGKKTAVEMDVESVALLVGW